MATGEAKTWRSRRVKSGQIRAGDIVPHPNNPKIHPPEQRSAVGASIDELGQLMPIVINVNNGYLVDGHERAWQALNLGEDTLVDVDYVDLSEDEHKKALIIVDRVGHLSQWDRELTELLMQTVQSDDERMQNVFASLGEDLGIVPPDFSPISMDDVPSLDSLVPKIVQCPCCECEFNLHDANRKVGKFWRVGI